MAATVVEEDIGGYLSSLTTTWTEGRNIFLGFMPDKPNECIAVIDVLGFEPPAETMGRSDINVERPQIQIACRGPANDYQTPRLNAKWAYKNLRNLVSTSLGSDTHYLYIGTRSSPYYQGEDENSRHFVGFTLDVWKEPST